MLEEYGLFLAKLASVVVLLPLLISLLIAAVKGSSSKGGTNKMKLQVEDITQHYRDLEIALIVGTKEGKDEFKKLKQQDKADKKSKDKEEKGRVYLLDFDGDTEANPLDCLRWEISAILTRARKQDQVVMRLESPGGQAHAYGLVAAQLERIRNAGIELTICVDKVAASGGYMMAAVANRIVAAPFAIIGSIGAVIELPNFNRFLKKHDVDVEQLTSGKHKRSLSLWGENTDEGRAKAQEDLQRVHEAFKELVGRYRPDLDADLVGTGEVWLGHEALGLNLVDELGTSDELLQNLAKTQALYLLDYQLPKKWSQRLREDVVEGVAQLFRRL